jgi:hypothetical protein
VYGGGWYSALYFTNTTSGAVAVLLSFTGDNGAPLNVPSVGSSITLNLLSRGTVLLEVPNNGSLTQGYVTATLPSGVIGYGIFRQSVSGRPDQEAVVPFSDRMSTSSTLIWDDANFSTAVAVVNPSSVPVVVSITVWNVFGNIIGTSSLSLGPRTAWRTAGGQRDL